MKKILIILLIILLAVLILVKDREVADDSNFLCSNGGEISIDYTNEEKTALLLSVPGAEFLLTQSTTSSGERFVNEDGTVVFYKEGSLANIEIDGEILYEKCEPAKNKSDKQDKTKDKDSGLNMEIFGELLVENKWQWIETLYSNDGVITPNNPEEFILTFGNNSEFSAITDCNTIMGSYTLGANSIVFKQMASTLKGCPETSQEQEFVGMLGEVERFWLTPDGALALTLKYDSGSMIFVPVK